jgi:hypothetical protein
MIEIDSNKHLVWIASYPRSGNTWVRAFLFSLYNVFRNQAFEAVDFNRLNEFSVWDNSLILFRKYLTVPPTVMDRKAIAALRPRVFKDLAGMSRGAVLVKTHNARIEAHGTPFIDESVTAGAIYVVRNPLDVAISFADFRNVSIDQTITDMESRGFGRDSDRYSVYWVSDSWTGNVRSWTDKADGRTLVVRYEDLRDKAKATFGSIARHLMMKPTDEQLAKALELTSFQNLRQREEAENAAANREGVPQFFRSGRAGQWRDVLTPEQVDRIVADHGKVMAKFGYLP